MCFLSFLALSFEVVFGRGVGLPHPRFTLTLTDGLETEHVISVVHVEEARVSLVITNRLLHKHLVQENRLQNKKMH